MMEVYDLMIAKGGSRTSVASLLAMISGYLEKSNEEQLFNIYTKIKGSTGVKESSNDQREIGDPDDLIRSCIKDELWSNAATNACQGGFRLMIHPRPV